ncbi:MAG TPA: zinc-binding dehydrogenase, partial [Bdellovibrionales bacterium]|nr:zinc-binding dehydrogenase [Bdellovibrionales bacterium]
VTVSAEDVAPVPDGLSPAEATALGTQFCTAWYAAEVAVRLHRGDRVLVHAAAGGVGVALVQIAKRHGCEIFGTASAPPKLELLRELGVDHPINYREKDFEAEIRHLTGREGVDFVFDSIGGMTYKKSMRLLKPGGSMVTFGVAEMAAPRRNPLKALKMLAGFGLVSPLSLLSKSQAVIGINMLQLSQHRTHVLRECIRDVVTAASKRELRPIVGAVFKAEDVAQAHELLGSGKSTGKVALIW